jgi:hypothetical protein
MGTAVGGRIVHGRRRAYFSLTTPPDDDATIATRCSSPRTFEVGWWWEVCFHGLTSLRTTGANRSDGIARK